MLYKGEACPHATQQGSTELSDTVTVFTIVGVTKSALWAANIKRLLSIDLSARYNKKNIKGNCKVARDYFIACLSRKINVIEMFHTD